MEKFYSVFEPQSTAITILSVPYRLNWCSAYLDCVRQKVITSTIDKYMRFYYQVNHSGKMRVYSEEMKELYQPSLTKMTPRKYNWKDYIDGCIAVLSRNNNKLQVGIDIYVENDLPSGIGLSSSACFIIGLLKILFQANQLDYDNRSLVNIAYQVEHDFLQIPCGLMDFKAVLHETGFWLIDTTDCDFTSDELIIEREFDISLLLPQQSRKHELLSNNKFKATVNSFNYQLDTPKEKSPAYMYGIAQMNNIKQLLKILRNYDKTKNAKEQCKQILQKSNDALNKLLDTDNFAMFDGVQMLGCGLNSVGFTIGDCNNNTIYRIIPCKTKVKI